jgi:aryl-alcohol dehydrogenase-like predicted oxidoreductase
VQSVIVGARSPREIEEDARLLDTAIPPELWIELLELST